MRYHICSLRRTLILLVLVFTASFVLIGCNYPTKIDVTATLSAVPTSKPPETAAPSIIFQPPDTVIPSDTLAPTETTSPSETLAPSATLPVEQVGVVILYGKEIGTIHRNGERFQYTANPDLLTPEVKGKVVLQVKDPQEIWGFNLENSSSALYNIRDDPRNGWEAYGVLLAYEGSYEITVKFIAVNVQSGEKFNGKVRIKIVGATVRITDTPDVGDIPEP